MSEMPSRGGGEDMRTREKPRAHGGMWAMWMCCLALLLFLLVSWFLR